MTRRRDILNELTDLSTLLSQCSTAMPYSVPDGYFDTLDTVIMARIAAGGNEEDSLLQVVDKQMPHEIPSGYFDTLAGSILSKIKAGGQSVEDELKDMAPSLIGLNKINVYEAPQDYFDALADKIIIKSNEPAKVVSIFSRKIWMRFSVAAAFIVFVGFGLKFFAGKTNNSSAIVPQVKTEEQIKTELAQISDEEIISYLKMNSDSKDAEMIASYIDQSKLPEAVDYMDDTFLDSFMKELEKTEHTTN